MPTTYYIPKTVGLYFIFPFHCQKLLWRSVLLFSVSFEPLDEDNILKTEGFEQANIIRCDHSNETSSAVLSHGTIYLVCSLTFESVDEILWCYH